MSRLVQSVPLLEDQSLLYDCDDWPAFLLLDTAEESGILAT